MIRRFDHSAMNGCKPILFENLAHQFRDMSEMEDLDRWQRLDQIKSRQLKLRYRMQKHGHSMIKLFEKPKGLKNQIIGMKVHDGSEEDHARFEAQLDMDKARRDGVIEKLDDRVEVAQGAGLLTAKEVKDYELPERKKTILLPFGSNLGKKNKKGK